MSTSFYIMVIMELVTYPFILIRMIRSLKKADNTMDKVKCSLVLSIFIMSLILLAYWHYLFVEVSLGLI